MSIAISYFFLHVSMLSVQFSLSVVSDSLRPHESQHARPPCPSPTPGVHSSSGPSNRWCHPTISSSVICNKNYCKNLTCVISYEKRLANLGLMQDTGCLGLVPCDDPERWYGEGSGRRVQDWEHEYTHADSCWCMAKPIQYCKVKKFKK